MQKLTIDEDFVIWCGKTCDFRWTELLPLIMCLNRRPGMPASARSLKEALLGLLDWDQLSNEALNKKIADIRQRFARAGFQGIAIEMVSGDCEPWFKLILSGVC